MDDKLMLATQAVIEVRSIPDEFHHIDEHKKITQDANNFLFFVQELSSKLPRKGLRPCVKKSCLEVESEEDGDSESYSSDSGLAWRLASHSTSLCSSGELDTDLLQANQASNPSCEFYDVARRSEERRFECPICGKVFKRRSSLSTHKLIHMNVKPFTCTECSKEFLRRSDLKKHSLMHSGHKPHVCSECGKMFSQSSNMLTHMRRHSGVRPFACDICGHSFYRKVDVRRHQSRHLKGGDLLALDASDC